MSDVQSSASLDEDARRELHIAADPLLPPIESLSAPDIDLSDLGDLRGSLALMQEAGILP